MTPQECKYCYRPITKKVMAEKRRRKIENALNSTKKRIANGNKSGPKSKRDDKRIKELREQYKTMTQIAKILGVSTMTVSRSLKEQGVK